MAIVAAAIGLHVVLLEIAGYVIAATVCFWGVAYAFGSRKILKDFFISALFALIVYLSFSKGLNINLPSGFFEGILSNGK
jgi:putative tricarboxylic transport membrane protein